jgi:5-methylcytosine-specific restriction endonuclease McrA
MRRRCLDCLTLIPSGSRCPSCLHDHTVSTDTLRYSTEPWRLLYRTAAWRRARSTVLVRDNRQCTRCHSTTHLQVHHRHRLADNDNDPYNINNLITLCARCYRLADTPRQRRQALT